LPFGFITAVFLFLFFKSPRAKAAKTGLKEKLLQMDLPGTAIFLPAVICLLLALHWGGSKYEWKNGRVIALLVLAGLLIVAFLVVQVIQACTPASSPAPASNSFKREKRRLSRRAFT
jgi:hypothetical protein